MKNTNKSIALETIMNDTILAVELEDGCGRHWVTGTHDEVKWAMESADLSDVDLCTEQPEHLKPFFDAYFEHQHGPNGYVFMTIPEFYEIWEG